MNVGNGQIFTAGLSHGLRQGSLQNQFPLLIHTSPTRKISLVGAINLLQWGILFARPMDLSTTQVEIPRLQMPTSSALSPDQQTVCLPLEINT